MTTVNSYYMDMDMDMYYLSRSKRSSSEPFARKVFAHALVVRGRAAGFIYIYVMLSERPHNTSVGGSSRYQALWATGGLVGGLAAPSSGKRDMSDRSSLFGFVLLSARA